MIELGRLKRWLAMAFALVGVVAGLIVVRQAADAVLRAASGADPTSIFNEPPPAPSELLGVIDWLPDPPREGREMEPTTREAITDAYARALAALDRSGRGDAAAPLREYLGGSALTMAQEAATTDDAVRSNTFHVRQDLELGFYSADGSIVAVSAPTVQLVRVLGGESAADRHVAWSDEAWRFVMVLEDGNWRIHQLEVVDVESRPAIRGPVPLDRSLQGINTVTVNGVDPTWQSFDLDVGIDELETVRDLGLDTVRVFVAAPNVGPVNTAALGTFLDAAAERDVDVVPVLFDGRADHSAVQWRDDDAYLDRVVGTLAGHEAIVMWDLKNEPDLDDERSGGAAVVDAWLDRVAGRVRRVDPATPITVGWSSANQATRVVQALDVVSFHHFGDATELDRAIRTLADLVGDRQLVVSEFGRPAWLGFVRGSQPAAQARRVDELLEVIDRHDLAGSAVWVLRDPDRPIEPGWAAGRASASYGLFDAEGTERPVARVIGSGGTATVAGPRPVEWIRAQSVTILLAIALGGAVITVIKRRGRRLIET